MRSRHKVGIFIPTFACPSVQPSAAFPVSFLCLLLFWTSFCFYPTHHLPRPISRHVSNSLCFLVFFIHLNFLSCPRLYISCHFRLSTSPRQHFLCLRSSGLVHMFLLSLSFVMPVCFSNFVFIFPTFPPFLNMCIIQQVSWLWGINTRCCKMKWESRFVPGMNQGQGHKGNKWKYKYRRIIYLLVKKNLSPSATEVMLLIHTTITRNTE